MSGDEIINDSFKINEVDGVVYEATCKMVEVTDDNNISQSIPCPKCAHSPQAGNSIKKARTLIVI